MEPNMRRALWLLPLAGLAAPPLAAPAPPVAYQVVVNTANPRGEIPAQELARIFLRTVRRWDSGAAVVPVDQTLTSPVRQAFTRDVLGQTPGQIQEYWLRQTFSGGTVPPPVRATEAAVLEHVRATEGAIGYVSTASPLPAGVKAVAVLR
jgi:ABC-type phosphate transport system substrate-binding protein